MINKKVLLWILVLVCFSSFVLGADITQLINSTNLNPNSTAYRQSLVDGTPPPPSQYPLNPAPSVNSAWDGNDSNVLTCTVSEYCYFAFNFLVAKNSNFTALLFANPHTGDTLIADWALLNVTYDTNISRDSITQLNFTFWGIGVGIDTILYFWNYSSDSYVVQGNLTNFASIISNSTTNFIDFVSFIPEPNITVTLESPDNNLITETVDQNFRCSANQTNGDDLVNITFFLWDSGDNIEASTFRDITDAPDLNETFPITSIADDSYNWNCEVTDINNEIFQDADNRSLIIDTFSPQITLDTLNLTDTIVDFDISYIFNETNPNACKYSLDNGENNVSFSSCGTNASTTVSAGTNDLTVYINDTLGREALDNKQFTVINITVQGGVNLTNVLETQEELFSLEVINGSALLVSAVLNFNNTEFTRDNFVTNGSSIFVNKTLDIPLIIEKQTNKSFWWNLTFNLGTEYLNVSTEKQNQSVEQIEFFACNETIQAPVYINYTIRNQTDNSIIRGNFNPAFFTYALQADYTPNRTLNFVNITDTFFHQFCFTPRNETLITLQDIDYSNSVSPQRNFVDQLNLTNATTNQNLFLLQTANGIFVTFQVINPAGQPLNNVFVTAFTTIGGSSQLIESGTTDDAGTVTFFLNPNLLHTMTFIREGFGTLVQFITPTESLFVITMSQAAVTTDTNFYEGIVFRTFPERDVLENDTDFPFSFVISSTFFDLTLTGYDLFNTSGTHLGRATCSVSTGCNASAIFNTGNHTGLRMNYFWNTQGNTTNGTRTWTVSETSGFTSSFNKFISDFSKFGQSFGTGTNAIFTRAIIAFFIILALTASLSFVSGITSPIAIVAFITAATAFFDNLGWLPSPGIPFFTTILMAFILLLFAIKEFK